MRCPLLLCLTLVSIFVSCRRNNEENPTRTYGQRNAVWAESFYLRGYKPSSGQKLVDQDIIEYGKILTKNNIKYVYLFAGPYGNDGHLPAYSFSDRAKRTIEIFKKHYPNLIILPWIGGIQNGTVFLGDSGWVQNALADTKKLVETLNIRGIHIDFEFLNAGNDYLDTTVEPEKDGEKNAYGRNVNEFHRRLRALMPDITISSVVGCTSSQAIQWKRKTEMNELLELTKYVDQISFLFYDTSIRTQRDFDAACAEQVRDIAKLRQHTKPRKVEYLLAIGTFVNRPELQSYRSLEIENIPNTLNTIKKCLNLKENTVNLIDGIAIFCDWETNKDEWYEIFTNWTSLQ